MRKNNRRPEEATIAVVYLLFPRGPDYDRNRPIRSLKKLLARLPGRKVIVYVDNSSPGPGFLREHARDEYEIGGDNRSLEFSGWQRGIDFLRTKSFDPDVWLFANDTFLTQSAVQRFALNRSTVECSWVHAGMVGKRLTLSPAAEIMGNRLSAYIRTHLFLLSAEVLKHLGSLVSLDEPAIERIMLSDFDPSIRLFKPGAPLSEETRRLVFSHLTNEWYRKKPYVAEHFGELRRKGIAILNSLMLSLRVDQLGYPLISYTKAARLLADEAPFDKVREEWLGGNSAAYARPPQPSRFWREQQYIYRHIPPFKRSLTLSTLLDLIENRPGREHM